MGEVYAGPFEVLQRDIGEEVVSHVPHQYRRNANAAREVSDIGRLAAAEHDEVAREHRLAGLGPPVHPDLEIGVDAAQRDYRRAFVFHAHSSLSRHVTAWTACIMNRIVHAAKIIIACPDRRALA